MSECGTPPGHSSLRILSVTQGQWGERIAENIAEHAPPGWVVREWRAPRVLPPIIDYPEDYVPEDLPPCDLILSLGEVSGLAQLIPDIARQTGAQAVLAPIDRNASLPPGLVRQLGEWLASQGVEALFPKPFCSLTPGRMHYGRLETTYDIPLISQFAEHFGRPKFEVHLEGEEIQEVQVLRDAACGCARYVAEGLIGIEAGEAVEKAGMLHHHFPCLASMNQDEEYLDTLMHVSGHILKDQIKERIREEIPERYIRPAGRSE